MNEQLRLLVELENLDTSIISIRKHINSLTSKDLAKHTDLNIVSSYEELQQNLRNLEKKKKDKERSIEEFDIKIKKLRDKASEIKTNKEYQAYIKEIDNMQKELSHSEDELLNIMELLDEQRKNVEVEKAKVAQEERKLKECQNKIQIEKNIAEEKLKLLMIKRKDITNKIDKDNYKIYMDIFKNCNGQAVVEVKNEICLGCNLHIPPQQYVEIKRNKEIISCPQCRRILYFSAPAKALFPAE